MFYQISSVMFNSNRFVGCPLWSNGIAIMYLLIDTIRNSWEISRRQKRFIARPNCVYCEDERIMQLNDERFVTNPQFCYFSLIIYLLFSLPWLNKHCSAQNCSKMRHFCGISNKVSKICNKISEIVCGIHKQIVLCVSVSPIHELNAESAKCK